eukprot:CAMPEP_0182467310 /NCGR_PEP_ID=MMETSP1319-20130603/13627_1 /TAXON_ID=172717 /ORGANISM="Bolidomonas pacifica, Strain RCC208" /LENGTH=304 /DNA_ID=CAMNT_0024667377 /DNA_START=94 /DNA_END=1005 /DNA_ORIENTATION=-
MASSTTPGKNGATPSPTHQHFGASNRRVPIPLPRTLQDLVNVVQRRYPRLVQPIQLFLGEGATEPLTDETFKSIKSGDILIALDAGGSRIPLGGGKGVYQTEAAASFTHKQSPPAKPCLPVDDRKFVTEYTQEFTGKEVEGGAEGQEPEVKFRMPKDDRNWLTESRAQFTEKSTKMVDPYKAVHQTESKDTPLNMPKDDRDWETENRRAFAPPTTQAPALPAFDPYQQHNLSDKAGFIFPSDDRSFVTENQAQFVEKKIEPMKPIPPLKDQYTGVKGLSDDRDWQTETSAQFTQPDELVYIWLE